MNAIEQMMQAFSANTAHPTAALPGTASAGSAATGFAEQFAATLQTTGESSPFAQAISDGSINIYAVTNISPASATPDSTAHTTATPVVEPATVDAIKLPAEVTEQLPAEGFQLVKVTPDNFATLFGTAEGVTLNGQPIQAQASAETSSAQFLIIQAPEGNTQSSVRLLPIAELEALISPELATGKPAEALLTSTANVTASPSGAATAAPLTGDTSQVNTQTGKAALEQQAATTNKPDATAINQEPSKLAREQVDTATIKIQKNAEAEAHGVQSQQVTNVVKKPPTASTTTIQQNTAQGTSTTANAQTSGQGQPGNEQSAGEQKQHPNPEGRKAPAMAVPTASAASTPQPAPAVTPQVTWTPERLSGFGESFAAETFSGGLSGLRGESSFLSSMGILGGKASPHMGGQIAKQLNLQVTNAVKNGANEFTMRLDPAELGRVQVKMQFGADGRVAAQIMVERPETLELLQREVRGLERAIESGGHKAANSGISFSLDTSDGESAGKAFAEAMHQDRLKEQLAQDNVDGDSASISDNFLATDQTDSAMLEEILSRVTPETGLDVRV